MDSVEPTSKILAEGNAVFTLNTCELRNKEFVLHYSSRHNRYTRGVGDHPDVIHGWSRGAFTTNNIIRLQDSDTTYLGQADTNEAAFISWKLDFKPFVLVSIAITNTSNEGEVQWQLLSTMKDGRTVSDQLRGAARPLEMHVGASELILTAMLPRRGKDYVPKSPSGKIFVEKTNFDHPFTVAVKLFDDTVSLPRELQIERGSKHNHLNHSGEDSLSSTAMCISTMLHSLHIKHLPKTVSVIGPQGSGKTALLNMTQDIMHHLQEYHESNERHGLTSLDKVGLIMSMLVYEHALPTKTSKTSIMVTGSNLIQCHYDSSQCTDTESVAMGLVGALLDAVREYAGTALTRTFRLMNDKKEISEKIYSREQLLQESQLLVNDTRLRWKACLYSFLFAFITASSVLTSLGFAVLNWPVYWSAIMATILLVMIIITIVKMPIIFRDLRSLFVILMFSQREWLVRFYRKSPEDKSAHLFAKMKEELALGIMLINWIASSIKREIRVLITVDNLGNTGSDGDLATTLLTLHDLIECKSSPFIMLLGVNSSVSVTDSMILGYAQNSRDSNCARLFEKAMSLKTILKSSVFVPELDIASKQQVIDASTHSRIPQSLFKKKLNRKKYCQCILPMVMAKPTYKDSLLTYLQDESILHYLGSSMNTITRIGNLLCFVAELVKLNGGPIFRPHVVVAWTAFLDLWPYRSHHIIWLIEHTRLRQQMKLPVSMEIQVETRFKDVFPRVRRKMMAINGWENMMSFDANSQLFLRFIGQEMKNFDVEDYYNILPITVNLNRSLLQAISNEQTARSMISQRNKELALNSVEISTLPTVRI
uniref:Uncharacterized protein LOC102802822 n=1 Tax=Saccoglossus kowalevskii TaxID=10224 RepID=A0ABM0MCE2_SACKO|nr:PREDICTED: uncharacterized protein LOC102802822 [Saccoglossus kowalevskii]